MFTIKLDHPTDPRYLLLPPWRSLPERITPDELYAFKYGKPMLIPATDCEIVYEQPDGPGTDWVKPTPPPSSEPTLPQSQS